ncbi:AraC family transcriptional regulator [Tessaracoccus caeni]|uniref:AraC family transcriptional regulator n=1 Tax=Tessaracoccus caeni TaxID=3031239 RepID=UPI0023D99FE5|nr:AraC family transcriptional regulator [Tessaracoccus caeni]MDF1487104.1 AraC family transcriptional regulator [Tessaracoccus caeni]
MSRSYPGPVGTSEPPTIPGTRSDSTPPPRRPALYWVRTGDARVRIDNAATFLLTAGEGLWIPEDTWDRHEVVTEPGTVAFPLWFHSGLGVESLSGPTRFEVPDGWQDWLIQLFNLQSTPFSGRGYSPDAITDLLRHPGRRSPIPPQDGNTEPSPTTLGPPPIPKARGARAVAEELIRDPALDLTVEQWATRALTSPSSLLRAFLADTGLTFQQWRLCCRLTTAVEHLAAGYSVDRVAALVGFGSRNGFTRAFKQQYGMTPHELTKKISAGANAEQRTAAARRTDDLMRMVRRNHGPAAPELLPAMRTPPHTNGFHVLSWMYRGSGFLDIGDRHYERRRGVATWIPAGLEHVTGLRANSVSLPLGDASPADLSLTEPLQVPFSPAWDDYLMFCSISARTHLHPDGYDPRHILGLFSEQLAAQRALSVPMPADPRARAVAMEYLRRIGSSGGSPAHDLSTELQRTFREETGMNFSRWRYAARMRIARDLLAGGAKPSAVARRVGYAHLPTFSTAFSRFHGMSPREYQERETDGT